MAVHRSGGSWVCDPAAADEVRQRLVTGPTDFAMHRSYAQTPAGQIHYAEAGDGPPLILMSETPRTHRQFARLMPLLSKHFRTIALDTPGFGNSHALPNPLTIQKLAGCVVAFLDALQLPKAHVFGLHTGNKTGAALASGWPDRVDRVVLAGMTHSIIPELADRNAAIRPLYDAYKERYGKQDDGSHLVRQWLAAHATASAIWWPQRLLTGTDIRPEEIEDVESKVSDYMLGWRHPVPIYEAVAMFDLAEAFAAIQAPTMILELTTPQEAHFGKQAERICATMQHGTPVSLPTTYMWALQSQHHEIADVVVPFLNAHPRP